jgi:hypothetical protein
MPKMIFVNLPVSDLAASTRFYESIGCERNPQFSDESASSMVWSETIVFQLLHTDYYATFTPKTIADARQTSSALIALTRESREEVDVAVKSGGSAGGTADGRPAQDMGFLYNRVVDDPDGHTLEFVWMDMSAAAETSSSQPVG